MTATIAAGYGIMPALIANIETGFTFSAPTAGIAATGAIFALIDPPALATAAGWMRHGVTGRVLFAALATIHQQTLTNATWTAFHYDSAQSNLGGAMNLATGNWTAPEAMVVQINAAIRVDNQTNNVPPVRNDLRVLKNGVEYCRLYSVPALHPSATISITVAAGDVIALQAFCFSFGLAIEAYTPRAASVVQIVQSQ